MLRRKELRSSLSRLEIVSRWTWETLLSGLMEKESLNLLSSLPDCILYSTIRPLLPVSMSMAESRRALVPGVLPSEKEIWETELGNCGELSLMSVTVITTSTG